MHFSGPVTHTGPLVLWFFEKIVPRAAQVKKKDHLGPVQT